MVVLTQVYTHINNGGKRTMPMHLCIYHQVFPIEKMKETHQVLNLQPFFILALMALLYSSHFDTIQFLYAGSLCFFSFKKNKSSESEIIVVIKTKHD